MDASPPELHAAPARGPALVLSCVLLALLAWSAAIARGGFAFDDREVLERNPVVEGNVGWREAFRRDYWEHLSPAGHVRPIATLSLRLDHALYGDDARGYHLTNVLLHAACVFLLGIALLLLGEPARPLAWFGLALFAVHPALADSVAWISGRTSMLAALGGLLGAVALLNVSVPWRAPTLPRALFAAAACAIGLLAALLSKEDGVVFAAVYVLLGLRHSRRLALAAALGSAAALVAYLALRAEVCGAWLPSAPHAPLAAAPLAERLWVGGRAALEGLRLAVLPLGYPPNYERAPLFDFEHGAITLGVLGWLVLAVLLFGGLAALRRRRASLAAWSSVCVALSALPMLQIVPAGALFAPRFLYLPLLLAAPLVDALARRMPDRIRRPCVVVLLAAACVGAWSRAGVYASRESFQRAQLSEVPRDPHAHNDLGLALEERGDLAGARAAYERALALDASYGRPWSNLGRLALERGEDAEAERCLRRAVQLGPGNAVARANLGTVLLRAGRAAEAGAAYARATELAPGLVTAWRGLCRASLACGRAEQAEHALRRAERLDPRDALTRALRAELARRTSERR